MKPTFYKSGINEGIITSSKNSHSISLVRKKYFNKKHLNTSCSDAHSNFSNINNRFDPEVFVLLHNENDIEVRCYRG